MLTESMRDDASRVDNSDANLVAAARILDGMDGAAILLGEGGRLSAANAAARRQFAIDALAPLPTQLMGVVLGPLSPAVANLMLRLQSGESSVEATHWDAPTSRSLQLRLATCPPDWVLLTVVDVTTKEREQVAITHALREASAVLELMPSSARIVDLTGNIVRMNASALAEHDEPHPRTLRALWEIDRPRKLEGDTPIAFLETAGMRALAGMTVRRELIALQRAEHAEPRMVEMHACPVYDDMGRVVGAVVLDRDVTENRRLERTLDKEVLRTAELELRVLTEAERIEKIVEERARAMAAREESVSRDRRLSAIGQLAAGVMHDVNNALNPIMAAAYLLRHYAESPDAVRDYADRIRIAAETGAATASRVGRFIRQEPMHAGAEEVLDLSLLAEEVLELTEPMPQRRATDGTAIRVSRSYAIGAVTRGLPGEIREALFNLVSNAMDAMPKGGTLTIETHVVGDEACVLVRDSGTGMTEEVRERAFEPFFSTKGAGGSGLGLAEVYGIARRHRGTVSIESAPGHGTTVSLRLPLERNAAPVEVVEAPPVKTEPIHILVVEDHEDGREFLKRLLRADGHTVDAVASCAEARERLASDASSSYHLMLTDVGLPDGSGWDLVAYTRERLPALRVGVITGWEPMVSSSEAVGAEFVLRKPLRAAELLAHIAGRKSPAKPG